MWEPMSGLSFNDLYEGAGRTTVEQTNPPVDSGPAKTIANNTGTRIAGAFGVELPALLALFALAVLASRAGD